MPISSSFFAGWVITAKAGCLVSLTVSQYINFEYYSAIYALLNVTDMASVRLSRAYREPIESLLGSLSRLLNVTDVASMRRPRPSTQAYREPIASISGACREPNASLSRAY